MKRLRLIVALFVLSLASAVPAFAQIQSGSISGTVKDEQGGVLPGVTVTAQGLDATQTFTTDVTGEFRFLNLAPGPYTLTATLPGFTTVVRENVIVAVGRGVDLPLTLKIAAVAETITVNGDSPIIDTKATGTATNFTSDELTKIPTSRDPFALMRSVPGVLVDRVNIGGNETGQQSNFASKGTRPQDAVWTMDGINITDMAATGASPWPAVRQLEWELEPDGPNAGLPNVAPACRSPEHAFALSLSAVPAGLDLRTSRTIQRFSVTPSVSIRGVFDVFNVFNANSALVRNNNIASPTFNAIAQNLSPRIARVGLVVGF